MQLSDLIKRVGWNLGQRSLIAALPLLFLLSTTPAFGQSFAIARVHYDGGGDWYSDPSSLVNLQRAAHKALGLATAQRETTVRLTDEDLFRHPYLYMTGHGNIRFSQEEADRLREHLLAGGFLHVDDNYGLDKSFRREMKKVFPDEEFVEIPFDHPVYHTRFDFDRGLPKIHEHDGKPAQGLAIVKEGRLLVFYSYECDLGDGWEDPDVHNIPDELRQAALDMGVNLIAYALSGQPTNLP